VFAKAFKLNIVIMLEINIYKVLTYILIPIAALFGLLSIIYFFMAFLMPAIFFIVFVFANITIYYIYAFIFLQKVIVAQKTISLKVKKVLRFTAIASLIFFTMSIVSAVSTATQSSIDFQVLQALENFKKINNQQLPLNNNQLLQIFKNAVIGFGIVSALFAVHILQSLNLSAKFKNSFT
jgi:hypothetical protein